MGLETVQEGRTLTIPCPAAGATVDKWYGIGGLLGRARNTQTSGLDLELGRPMVGEVIRMPKATGFVPVLGEVAFFDFGTDNRLEAYSTGADVRPVGWYAAAALTGDTAARVVWDPAAAAADVIIQTVTIYLDATKAVVQTAPFIAPFAGKIIGLQYYADVKPSSASGTCLLTAINASVSDNTLIATANIDLEAITEDALTAMTLTSTAADLVLAKAAVAEFVATSNNTDLVAGSGIHIRVAFQRTGN